MVIDPRRAGRFPGTWRSTVLLMVGSCFIGAQLLKFLAFRFQSCRGGGLVVVSMGWSMLMEKEEMHEKADSIVPSKCLRTRVLAFDPATHGGSGSHFRCDVGRQLDLPL